MLDLYHDVVVEFSVKTFEELDSGIGTVRFPVALVQVLVVVHEGTEEDGSVVRSQSTGELVMVSKSVEIHRERPVYQLTMFAPSASVLL